MRLLPSRRPRADAAALELFRDAAAGARQVYSTTAGTHAARLTAVTDAHLLNLARHGLLTVDPPGMEVSTPEDDARWLAAESGHPRFSGDDGWRQLLEPAADGLIQMAYRNATGRHGGAAERQAFTRAAEVRDRLLRHATEGGCTV